MGAVVQVSGAVGGVGATTLAWAVALQRRGSVVLVDAQPDGAPLYVAIGADGVRGARWSQVHVATPDIEAEHILAALPEWHGVRLLSSDHTVAYEPALQHVVGALREAVDLVVVDAPLHTAIARTDLRLAITSADVQGICAVVGRADENLAVVTTNPERRRAVDDVARYLPVPHVGHIRRQPQVSRAMHDGLDLPANCDAMRIAGALLGALWQ